MTSLDDFHINSKSKVEIVLPKLDTMKIITWNFHVDYSQGNHKYNMILRYYILSELQIDICLSDNTIRGNICVYAGCTAPIKYVTNINFNASSAWTQDESFWKE